MVIDIKLIRQFVKLSGKERIIQTNPIKNINISSLKYCPKSEDKLSLVKLHNLKNI